jgi:hypothetical protein
LNIDSVIEIVNQLMAKEPSERFSSMGEVAAALRPYAMVVASMVQQAAATGRAGKRAAAQAGAGKQVAAAQPVAYAEQESYNGAAGYATPPVAAQIVGRPGNQPPRQPGGGGQYDRTAARPTPQPVSDSYGDTVSDVQGGAQAGFSALRDSLHQDSRMQQQQSGSAIGPAGYGMYPQNPPQQGIGVVTLVMVVVLSIILAFGLAFGVMIWLVHSGMLKLG